MLFCSFPSNLFPNFWKYLITLWPCVLRSALLIFKSRDEKDSPISSIFILFAQQTLRETHELETHKGKHFKWFPLIFSYLLKICNLFHIESNQEKICRGFPWPHIHWNLRWIETLHATRHHQLLPGPFKENSSNSLQREILYLERAEGEVKQLKRWRDRPTSLGMTIHSYSPPTWQADWSQGQFAERCIRNHAH